LASKYKNCRIGYAAPAVFALRILSNHGSMTENNDKVGGEGTGAFAKQVIDIYIARL